MDQYLMDRWDALLTFLRGKTWAAYKTRVGAGFWAFAAHALVLALFVFNQFAMQVGTPGKGEELVSVSLMTNADAEQPEPELLPEPVVPKVPVVQPPVITIMPVLAELAEAAPQVTNQNASRGDSEYYARLTRHTLRFMRYPMEAKLNGDQGVVWIHIIVDREGAVRFVEIEKSSGVPLLDTTTLELIARAAPMPPFPANVTRQYFNTMIPFGYRLQ